MTKKNWTVCVNCLAKEARYPYSRSMKVCNVYKNTEGTLYLLVSFCGPITLVVKLWGKKLHFVTPFGINDKVPMTKKNNNKITL